ncbi:hypothetical protein [Fuerstiella marisgermanici]|uniref:hypothetical protein n=1 Tax=Fuerstiella marisgermanici TaxID=1891926 RepID=UPI00097C47C9|nr:hypothetical protein [Fuerstiella marisgermanici]
MTPVGEVGLGQNVTPQALHRFPELIACDVKMLRDRGLQIESALQLSFGWPVVSAAKNVFA